MKKNITFIFYILIFICVAALGVYASIKADKEGKKIDAENDALMLQIQLTLDSILMDIELRKMELKADTILHGICNCMIIRQ